MPKDSFLVHTAEILLMDTGKDFFVESLYLPAERYPRRVKDVTA